ncbi:glycosyltransferase family 2 protein [Pseudomonas moraviensis]|uniref:Glycosyltransferase involved in cell wall biosynthesis n=1 Tax=Pseudomonas moraviensis TaxID=321662 RepID=A0A7Y9VXB7_9PSED|nr:glycosyltransferase family 2 protein [Pseudomonas moraviensis]NYH10302.1 glycosyltransferase involved in cell wall biosynthesis [Pseudomonas moraviensis]
MILEADEQSVPVLSVVIPVYRAEKTLHELYRRLITVLETMQLPFELILVEDSGGDQSWKIIQTISKDDDRVRGINFSRNFGQHAATICGFSVSRGQWVITLDDDLEQSPEHIPALYERALQGADLVYGVYPERSHSHWRNFTSATARWMFNKAIPSLNYAYTSYRVIRGDVARALSQFDSPYPFVDGYLSWLTNNYATVPVPHDVRAHGESNYTFRKLFTHTVNIFVTFSDLPLRMATWLGFIAFILGGSWLLAIFVSFLTGHVTVSGYASIMAGILAFGGVQLLVLGIFGEYLGRINFKSSRKPLYLVREETGKHGPD